MVYLHVLGCLFGTQLADASQFNAAILGNDAPTGWDRNMLCWRLDLV